MRNSYNFILNFVPRIIVVLVLFTMDCTNANAENVYPCADQSKCANIQPESGTCNSYTIGQGTIDGVSLNGSYGFSCSVTPCVDGTWYCLDSADGACAVYDCTSCSTELNLTCSTHNYSLSIVNGGMATGTPCNYVLGGTSEPLDIHGCAFSSCHAGYYKTQGASCKFGGISNEIGSNISGVGGVIVRPISSNSCCKCPSNSTSSAYNTGGEESCECVKGYYGDPGNGVACTRCPEGSTTISTGATAASNCVCSEGFYGSGGNFCTACPKGYTSVTGATKISQCYSIQQEDGTGYFEYGDKCYYPNK